MQLYLIKEGEISLKGQNRSYFEKQLRHNLKDKLRPYHSNISRQKGRLFVETEDECPEEVLEKAFRTTFGITGYAKATVCEKSIDEILQAVRRIAKEAHADPHGTFRIRARREDKSFSLTSYDLSCLAAEIVHEEYPEMKVDLKEASFTIYIEVRNKVYLYTDSKRGPGGLPTGTAGRGLLLLSGGIDSPVAAVEMAKRGLKMDCLYFHAYPYTSEEALEKVKKLASLIAPYLCGTRLFVIPFTEQQLYLREKAYPDETTLMFRACMMQSAERIASRYGNECIITGEALSQVASQTLKAMSFTDSMSNLLVLRPLVGMDKEEIIRKSRDIGTYETSILPYEDCCVIFSPKHPVTNPEKELMHEHYQSLGMDALLDKAVSETELFAYDAKGEEIPITGN